MEELSIKGCTPLSEHLRGTLRRLDIDKVGGWHWWVAPSPYPRNGTQMQACRFRPFPRTMARACLGRVLSIHGCSTWHSARRTISVGLDSWEGSWGNQASAGLSTPRNLRRAGMAVDSSSDEAQVGRS